MSVGAPTKRILGTTAALALAAALATAGAGTFGHHRDPTPYQKILRSQVDKPDGSPRPGRNPADVRQMSLAEAASAPTGAALHTAKPARKASRHNAPVNPKDVLRAPKATGRLSNGCALGYGDPGAQCLPSRAPNNKPLTCAYVVHIFPKGVRVTGHDALGLDSNHDHIACDHGDRGVR
jgi:hypothetical protein